MAVVAFSNFGGGMEMQFQPGDIVELKSGGPPMTVDHPDLNDPGRVCCYWFDPRRRRNEASFSIRALKSVESKPKHSDSGSPTSRP
jgi:uncharacterized protein YodC (DUF2158 family)